MKELNKKSREQCKSWNGKPYRSLDYMLRERFGEKVYKVTLNGQRTRSAWYGPAHIL